jgi:hypothetical protein
MFLKKDIENTASRFSFACNMYDLPVYFRFTEYKWESFCAYFQNKNLMQDVGFFINTK